MWQLIIGIGVAILTVGVGINAGVALYFERRQRRQLRS